MDVRELAELLAQARQWQSLAAPGSEESYEGHDHTDSVTARVDASGALTNISVVDRWNRGLDPDALGDAIREASAAAVSARYGFAPPAPGAAAVDWGAAFDDVIATPPAAAAVDDLVQAEAQVAEATAMIERETARVSIADARETYLSQLDRLLSHPLPSFDGRQADVLGSPMQVELELSPAGQLVRCAVNSRWAGSQSGNALTMRLGELLADHRDGR